MIQKFLLLGLALAMVGASGTPAGRTSSPGHDVETGMPQSPEDPRTVVRSALRSVEGDSAPALRARWMARLQADPSDRLAILGLGARGKGPPASRPEHSARSQEVLHGLRLSWTSGSGPHCKDMRFPLPNCPFDPLCRR